MDTLSTRGRLNVSAIMAKIPKDLLEVEQNNGVRGGNKNLDLSMAENWLVRREVLEIGKAAIAEKFDMHHLNWPSGFWGNTELLDLLANFFNSYFQPRLSVDASHIAVAPGAAYALDAILYNICDVGDGILVPEPYWNGNDIFFRVRSSVNPVPALVPDFQESFGLSLLSALEKAYSNATCPIKALMLANPHNPLGQCYSKLILEKCFQFCTAHQIHFICDEVFALCTFKSHDLPKAEPFVSALSLDPIKLGGNASKIHVVWSMSKILGSSSLKLGCTITQSNNDLRNALALASPMNVSTLSSIFAIALLSSPKLPSLIATNSVRLTEAYNLMSAFLHDHNILYFPSSSGVFILAKVAPNAQTWEDENAVIEKLERGGVSLGAGRRYHLQEKGWARISFALEMPELEEAIRRMGLVFKSLK